MRDCTLIARELVKQMTIEEKYNLKDLYKMIESVNIRINDCRHKIRAVLEKRKIARDYQIIYHGNAEYSLVRTDNYNDLEIREVA